MSDQLYAASSWVNEAMTTKSGHCEGLIQAISQMYAIGGFTYLLPPFGLYVIQPNIR